MKPQELLKQYLEQQYMMQLATTRDGRPWICTVWFIADAHRNLYWASLPTRRHSQDIVVNSEVAAAIAVQYGIGESVIGVQLEGGAEMLEPEDYDRAIVKRYAERFLRGDKWLEDFLAGNTLHRLYRLKPTAIYLFDEEHLERGKRHQVL